MVSGQTNMAVIANFTRDKTVITCAACTSFLLAATPFGDVREVCCYWGVSCIRLLALWAVYTPGEGKTCASWQDFL